VFGFLPIGLAYHALYCVAVTVLMWTLTRVAWPAHLETTPETVGDGPASAKPTANGSARSHRRSERKGGRR
jgi:hypothetical protein